MASKRVEEEYQSCMEGNLWPMIYQRISQRCTSFPYTCVEAKKTENKPLNRYRDVNPYDHSRIVLQREGFVTDYINANLVKVERANRQYILTQGPLVYTSGHFWLMVWEQNSPAIIMLNKIIEKSEIKCHWYWPHEDGEAHKVTYPDVNMSITQVKEFDNNYYTIRRLILRNHENEESRELWHYHYTTWPDFEVPQSPHAFLDFLKRVREYGALDSDGVQGPAIVHCSAGIGRSGTFCLVDSVLVMIENDGQADVDIQEILLDMRRYRMGLIQTSEQLRFSYKAIVEGIKRLDPNYVPSAESMNESIYSAVADEEEAPPPPPPRGESLGRPPARPLPAIPASASMEEGVMVLRPLTPLALTMHVDRSLYARRRTRALQIAASGVNLAGQRSGGVPTLAALAATAAGVPARAVSPAVLLPLALLAAIVVLNVPLDHYGQPLSVDDQLQVIALQSVFDADVNPIRNSDPITLSDALEIADDQASVDSCEDPPLLNTDNYISLEDMDTFELSGDCELPYDEDDPQLTANNSNADNLSNIELSANVESEESDAPPTPPPRDARPPRPPRDSPSPASSGYADEDIDDEDDVTTENTDSAEHADTAENGGGEGGEGSSAGVRRRRRAALLAERVALMKKRSSDADHWHALKRSLFKPLAISVGVGLLAVAGVLIYTYTKH